MFYTLQRYLMGYFVCYSLHFPIVFLFVLFLQNVVIGWVNVPYVQYEGSHPWNSSLKFFSWIGIIDSCMVWNLFEINLRGILQSYFIWFHFDFIMKRGFGELGITAWWVYDSHLIVFMSLCITLSLCDVVKWWKSIKIAPRLYVNYFHLQ